MSTKVGRRLLPRGRRRRRRRALLWHAQAHPRARLQQGRHSRHAGGSLWRLGTDRIDIALIHDPDDCAEEALDGAYAALDQLRCEGMIRAVDVGMNQPPLLECFVKRADLDCVLMAGRYSLLDTAAANSLLPCCQRHGVAVLAAGAFNSGILADPRHGATYDSGPATADLLDRAQRIRVVCARYGVPIGTAAIRFVLQHPAVTAVVVGTRHAAEVIEDVSYLTAAVPADLFSELAAERLIPEAADRS